MAGLFRSPKGATQRRFRMFALRERQRQRERERVSHIPSKTPQTVGASKGQGVLNAPYAAVAAAAAVAEAQVEEIQEREVAICGPRGLLRSKL